MKYVTFNQALLAVGLLSLTLALTNAEGNSFGIAASLLVDDGPSIGAPVALLAVSIALPLGILGFAWVRLRAASVTGEPASLPTHAETRTIIGLVGLFLLTPLAPQVVTASSVSLGDSWAGDAPAWLIGALIIPLAIVFTGLGGGNRDKTASASPQALPCLGLIALVIVAAATPAHTFLAFTKIADTSELFVFLPLSRVHWCVALALTLVILAGVLRRSDVGNGWAVVVTTLLVGTAASINLFHTFFVGLPLAALVAAQYFASREGAGRSAPVRSGPLLVGIGLWGFVIGALSIPSLIHRYDLYSDIDATLYLWPTIALALATAFNLGLIRAGLQRHRTPAPAAEDGVVE